MNTRSIKLIVIFIEVIIVVCSCIYIIRYTNDNKIASLDSWIDEVITDRRSKKDGFITKQDVAELLKITPDQAYSEIRKLVSEGKIYKYCGGKYTKYKLR